MRQGDGISIDGKPLDQAHNEAVTARGTHPQRLDGRDRRWTRTRFVVPIAAYSWHTRGIAVAALLISCLTGGLAWWAQQRIFHSMGFDLFGPSAEAAGQFARATLLANGLLFGLSCGLMTFAAMFLAHRILGPVYRLQSHMQSILEGKPPTELILRNTDQLKDVVSTYNALLQSLDLMEPKPMANSDSPPVLTSES